jgi:hypothetical protein
LRGFPVGSLIICKHLQTQRDVKAKHGECKNPTHHLLDGQQRSNAIALGFVDPFLREDIKDAIWIDLSPDGNLAETSRSFLLRVTTESHPWGYISNDSAGKLSHNDIRDSLKKYGWRDEKGHPISGKSQRPTINNTWPIKANIPVPLAWLFESASQLDDMDSFWGEINNKFTSRSNHTSNFFNQKKETFKEFINNIKNENQRSYIFNTIKRALALNIVLLELSDDVLSEETIQERLVNDKDDEDEYGNKKKQNISNIEHLFHRLNSQGTPLSPDDRIYSMIKAYWPSFEEPIRENTFKHLPDAKFANLVVRAVLTTNIMDKLHDSISVNRIRKIAKNHKDEENEKKDLLEKFFNADINKVEACCELVDFWLLYREADQEFGIPPFIRSEIAYKSSEIYLLIFWLAKRELEYFDFNTEKTKTETKSASKTLIALATSAHWFCINSKHLKQLTNEIFSQIKDKPINPSIFNGIFSSKNSTSPVSLPPDNLIIESIENEEITDRWWNWDHMINNIDEKNGVKKDFLRKIKDGKSTKTASLLTYAQRKYVNVEFTYDPSNISFWIDHNRPWDYDHIQADAITRNKKSENTWMNICHQFSNTLGNLRVVSFEENRSDQAMLANAKIITEQDIENSFLLDKLEVNNFSIGRSVISNSKDASIFIRTTHNRLIRIYSEWWNQLDIDHLFNNSEEPDKHGNSVQ